MTDPSPACTTAPLLLTPEEAARLLRIGRTRLYQLIASGDLPSIKLGGSRRIAVIDLEAFVRRLRQPHVAPTVHDGQRARSAVTRGKPGSNPGQPIALPLFAAPSSGQHP